MALNQFIASVRREVAKKFDLKTDAEINAFFIGMEESAKDNQESLEKRDKMLKYTVAELSEAKRLLKLAVTCLNDGGCTKDCDVCTNLEDCIRERHDNSFKWRYTDEALKLLREDGESNG